MRRRSRRTSGGAVFGFAVLGATAMLITIIVSVIRPDGARNPPPSASAPSPPDPFPNEWPHPPPADVAALLSGLGPNTPLVGRWRVRGVSPVIDGRVVLDVDRGDVGMRVWIVQRER